MRIKSFTLACIAIVAVASGGSANAQSCVGFTDVSAGSSFCPNVEWLKNRQVTLGCTSATLYCPNNSVTRLQMAAFLNRVGIAVTPIELAPVVVAAAPRVIGTALIICETADFALTGVNAYPRRAYVNGFAHLSAPTANVDVQAALFFSTNGGASWTPINATSAFAALYTGGSPGNHVTLSPYGWQDLNVNQTVRFGLAIGRFAGTGDVTAGCNLSAQIANRNPTSSPF